MTWDEVCADRSLRDLPFRIETNRLGQVVLSPLHNDRSFACAAILKMLLVHQRGGGTLQNAAIDTEDGTQAAGTGWMSAAFLHTNKGGLSFRRAPEICVEVNSPGNTQGELLAKKDLYLKADAREVWIREQSGRMLFFNATGPLERSELCPTFPKTVKV